jgi:hypothetical protein
MDQFCNKIGNEGGLATTGLPADVDIEVLAVADTKIVLAHTASTPSNQTNVQLFPIIEGVATMTNDISVTAAPTATVDDFRRPNLTGSTLDDLQRHVLLEDASPPDANPTVFTFSNINTTHVATPPMPADVTPSSDNAAVKLANGNRVIVIASNGREPSNTTEIDFAIPAPDGTGIASGASTSPAGGQVIEPQVAALASSGFAMLHRTDYGDGDIAIQLFDAAGIAIANTFDVMNGVGFGANADNQNVDPEVMAQQDGGFIALFERGHGDNRVLGRRYDADGSDLGAFFEVGCEVGDTLGVPVAKPPNDGLIASACTNNSQIETGLFAGEALRDVLPDADKKITGTKKNVSIERGAGLDALAGGNGDGTADFHGAFLNADLPLNTHSFELNQAQDLTKPPTDFECRGKSYGKRTRHGTSHQHSSWAAPCPDKTFKPLLRAGLHSRPKRALESPLTASHN